jgi:phosphohistidine phosphatase
VQTAEIIATEVDYRDEIKACLDLSPGSDPGDLIKLLATYGGDGPLAVIGHEPSLSLVATSLLGDGASAAWTRSEPSQLKKSPVFKKSAVMGISWEDGKGELRFVLDPKELKAR